MSIWYCRDFVKPIQTSHLHHPLTTKILEFCVQFCHENGIYVLSFVSDPYHSVSSWWDNFLMLMFLCFIQNLTFFHGFRVITREVDLKKEIERQDISLNLISIKSVAFSEFTFTSVKSSEGTALPVTFLHNLRKLLRPPLSSLSIMLCCVLVPSMLNQSL